MDRRDREARERRPALPRPLDTVAGPQAELVPVNCAAAPAVQETAPVLAAAKPAGRDRTRVAG